MPRGRGRAPAAILVALLLVASSGGCSTTTRPGHESTVSRSESSAALEEEILSGPYDENGDRNPETAEEEAGGVMVAVMFVGMVLGLAIAPILLLGPLGIF